MHLYNVVSEPIFFPQHACSTGSVSIHYNVYTDKDRRSADFKCILTSFYLLSNHPFCYFNHISLSGVITTHVVYIGQHIHLLDQLINSNKIITTG